MAGQRTYCGVYNDRWCGMTHHGHIVRDAWVFEIISETETCEGWNLARIENLSERVRAQWDKHGLLVSRLPPELRERHTRIYEEAVLRAKAAGWDPELAEDD